MNRLTRTPLPDADTVARTACRRILSAAEEAIRERGAFHLVLAGGTTPERTYRLLARSEADWSRWHLYFSDERCLPPDDPERNSRMAEKAWTGRVAIPESQIHPIPTERGAEQAAAEYGRLIGDTLPFDMVLLGMGEDGHTASLFPGHRHPEGATAVPVHDAPKPPPERVSLSDRTLGNCRHLLFLITGGSKQAAVRAWRAGKPLPVSRIEPLGSGEVLIDAAAEPSA